MFGRTAVSVFVTGLVAVPAEASAGGWASYIDSSRYAVVGEEFQAGAELLFPSIAEAEAARRTGRYYAYLIEDFDWRPVHEAMSVASPGAWWTLGGAPARVVGTVGLAVREANLARASTRFVVPDIEPGEYTLMFCDAGCANPLGDIVPTRINVVPDPLTVQLVRRFERLKARTAERVAELRAELREARSDPSAPKLAQAGARMRGLELRLARLEESADAPWFAPGRWLATAAWFLAGIALTAVIVWARRRRRLRPRTGPKDDEPVITMEDVRELVGSGRS